MLRKQSLALFAVSVIASLCAAPLLASARLTYTIGERVLPVAWAPSAFPIKYQVDRRVMDSLPNAAVVPADDSFEINGRRVSFEGREEVVLRCGEASITLRADGQVIVKGTRVMSRASEANKIRGATVQIN